MNLINTNYAFAKGPSFAAKLNLQNKNRKLTAEEIELLKQSAARIGNDSDTIDIKVGELDTDMKGRADDPEFTTSCTISGRATLGGKTTEKNMNQEYSGRSDEANSPYYILQDYLARLQQKASPVTVEKIPDKIAALEKELQTAQADSKTIEAELKATEKKHADLVAAKKVASAKEEVIGDEIERLNDRLKQYKKITEGEDE